MKGQQKMRNKNIKSLWLKGKVQTDEERILREIEQQEQKEFDKQYLEQYYNYEM